MTGRTLSELIKIYDGDLDPQFCQKLVASFDQSAHHHKPNGRGHRAGLEESSWVELDITRRADQGFLDFFRMKVNSALDRYNRDVKLTIPVPNSPKLSELIMKRYIPDSADNFQVHFDSIYALSNRFMVLLWYLNDVAVGGETVFPDLGVSVSPRAGRLLMFPPYWTHQHAGLKPISNHKYILSTYLLF